MSTDTVPGAPAADTEQIETGRVVTIAAGHAVHDTYTAFLPPLLPVFIDTLSLTKTEAGFLTVFFQAPSLLQPFIGHLADRVSLRYLVIMAPAVAGVMMSLLGLAPTYGALALLLILAGLNSAVIHSVAPVMAGRLSGNKLGRGMGFWMVGGELGRTLGPLIIGLSVQFLTPQSMPLLMVGGLVASALLFFRLKDVPGRPPADGQALPWGKVLRAMGPFLVPLMGIVLVRAFMVVSLTTYLPIFLTDEGAELWFAAVSLAILEAAGVVGALTGGGLSDRWGRRKIIAISLLVTPLLMFAFLAASGWVRFPLLVLLGFTSLSVTPVMMAMVQESFPENRALANGTYMALNFVLRSGAVIVLGLMGDRFGMSTAFSASAVITFLGLPLLLVLPARQH